MFKQFTRLLNTKVEITTRIASIYNTSTTPKKLMESASDNIQHTYQELLNDNWKIDHIIPFCNTAELPGGMAKTNYFIFVASRNKFK